MLVRFWKILVKGINHGKANFLGVVTILTRQSRSLRTNTFLREIFGLFRKAFILREPGGEYFFAAIGGAGTRYANEEHGNCVMGMVIVPLRNSEDAALITKIIKCEAVDERYARWPGVRDFDQNDGTADFLLA